MARFSDFWNFAVAIICMVLVILRMFRTALRRLTIARALAMAICCAAQRNAVPTRCFGRQYQGRQMIAMGGLDANDRIPTTASQGPHPGEAQQTDHHGGTE